MSELLKKYGGLILFYGIIILGVFMLNERFNYLNRQNNLLEEKNIVFQKGGVKNV